MKHEVIQGEPLAVVGIAIRTNNAEARETIAAAWHRFLGENLLERIPNRRDDHTVVGVYTDYASDENGEYTFMIGAPVTGDEPVPEGLERRQFPAQRFARIVATGAIPAVVVDTWTRVYSSDLPRSYTVDIEKYDVRRMGSEAELELLVALDR